MAVQNRTHLGSLLHNRKMKEDLARTFTRARDLIAFHIDDAQILGLHKPFANLSRRAHDAILVDSVANIAVVSGGESAVVQSATNIANLVFHLM